MHERARAFPYRTILTLCLSVVLWRVWYRISDLHTVRRHVPEQLPTCILTATIGVQLLQSSTRLDHRTTMPLDQLVRRIALRLQYRCEDILRVCIDRDAQVLSATKRLLDR